MKYTGYIILVKDKEGSIFGYTEHSMSMGFAPDRVRVDRMWELMPYNWKEDSSKLKGMSPRQFAWNKMQARVNKISKYSFNKDYKFKAFKIGTKNCPVIIDWREIRTMLLNKKKHDKFKWRNLPFKIKENAKLNFD